MRNIHSDPEAKAQFRAQLMAGLVKENVPEHMHDGYLLYFLEGISPGSFGVAVLENNLREACARADSVNQRALFQHVSFLYNYAPVGSWGSEANVANWMKSVRQVVEAL